VSDARTAEITLEVTLDIPTLTAFRRPSPGPELMASTIRKAQNDFQVIVSDKSSIAPAQRFFDQYIV
jgi:hypothetical protein